MKILQFLMFALALSANVSNSRGQANDKSSIGQWSPNEWAWTSEKWTGDGQPYLRMRQEIDQLITNGQNPDTLALQYKALASKDSSNSQSQFRWGYAAYKTAAKPGALPSLKLDGVEFALRRAKEPRNYEYTRLHFLVVARLTPYHQLKELGTRLLRHNPKDDEVKFYLVSILDPGLYNTEKQQALKLAQELARSQPKRASTYSLIGETYLKVWIKSKSQGDADKSIAAYQQFLRLAPPNHQFRRQAQNWIKFLQKAKTGKRSTLSVSR